MKSSFALLACLVVLAAVGSAHASTTCLDENGNPVDWWIILKAPYLHGSSATTSGYGYSYADANSPAFTLSSNRLDTNLNGALGSTLNQIYNADSSRVGWVIYNDQTPDDKEHTSNGHTKGDMAFDANGGFWLVHSVPRFPAATGSGSYAGYPAYAKEYGQSFICMSYDLNNINLAAGGFLLNEPHLYDSNVPPQLVSSLPNVQAAINGQFNTREVATNVTSLRTQGGTNFLAFAKNKKWDQDLWSALVSPTLNSGLLIESWMDGANTNKMPTFCKPQYSYNNINVRQVALDSTVTWPETKDHSKWAIATDAAIFCIGDINRQFSQAKRGGGTVCAQNPNIWAAFKKIIAHADSC
ncbi:deoxyribonuclease II, putative [Acanthamoeba castellanii str. Neff]|uniref:Deoxyribonuclease II, putative n=1 Tax=Acanthamoeba castellanii (strain ATCC 30010 / Neff) TaxID=1257118 RepID=L8GV23_ACACF|nr:deoxyribonuclease II, putative [Acanthamoeba castellanii str. Neff]ELR16855.1 deoxyribonuclease II, putative [Acanthamoeba castellanii str. Neff]